MNSSTKLLRLAFARFENSLVMAPLLSYPEDPTECRMGGLFGSMIQSFYDLIARVGYNCTMMYSDRIGSYSHETGKWDGLVGLLQDKKVDISMFIFERPMPGLGDVQYTLPLFESQLCLGCSYNYSNKAEDFQHYDILDMFINFDGFSYFITAMWFIFFVLIWSKMQRWISVRDKSISDNFINQRKSSWWVNICAILDQDQHPDVNLSSISILSICISLFYWIMFDNWMLGIMGTDMTVVKPPYVPISYQDILDSPGKRIVLSPILPETRFFRDAKVGTSEHKLYENAYITGTDIQTMMVKIWNDVVAQKYVAIFRCMMTYLIAQLGINITRKQFQMDYIRAWIIPDPAGRSMQHAHLYQKNLPDDIKIPAFRLISRGTQSGLYKYVTDELPRNALGESILKDQFISTKLILPGMPDPFVQGQDVIRLIYGLLIFIAFSSFVLLCEILFKKLRGKKSKEKIAVKVKSYT